MAISQEDLVKLMDKLKADINENTTTSINAVRADINANIATAIDSLQQNLTARFTSIVADVKKDVEIVQQRCDGIESRIERLERLSHLSDLILNGVPYNRDENLRSIYRMMCETITFDSPEYVLQSIFRLGNKNSSQASIIMKFISSEARNNFYFRYLKFKNLALIHIGFTENIRIYVQESLSKTNANIFRKAMELKRIGKLYRAYTHNGIVFVKYDVDTAAVQCFNLSDLLDLDETLVGAGVHKRKPSNDADTSGRPGNGTKYLGHGNPSSSNQRNVTPVQVRHHNTPIATSVRSSSSSISLTSSATPTKIDRFFTKTTDGNSHTKNT